MLCQCYVIGKFTVHQSLGFDQLGKKPKTPQLLILYLCSLTHLKHSVLVVFISIHAQPEFSLAIVVYNLKQIGKALSFTSEKQGFE